MTEFDPTTNRIPIYLMTVGEERAMRAWPHGWEYASFSGWMDIPDPEWSQTTVYRGKPKPVVTSVWFNVYPHDSSSQGYKTREAANDMAYLDRIAVLRIDTCNGVSTAHLENV
jgi:hypothetical protein